MSTVAYLRVSTSEQAESGLGIDAQRAAIQAHAQHIDAEYIDEGYSGSDAKRPGLLNALAHLRKGDVLIVAKRDRLARDTFLALWLEKEAKRRGARIISAAGEGTESDDPASVLMRTLIDAFAAYERQIIGQRTSAALKAKRSRGEKTGGGCPFGYDIAADGKTLIPNAQEQRAIDIITELHSRGHSLRRICSELAARGIETKAGKPWHPQSVRRVLVAA